MEKKNTILLTVIAIATLLVAVVGATFAYFTAQVSTKDGDVGKTSVRTYTLASAVMDRGNDVSNTEGVYPGTVIVKPLVITGACADKNGCEDINSVISVTAEIDDAFGTDVTWRLYKGKVANSKVKDDDGEYTEAAKTDEIKCTPKNITDGGKYYAEPTCTFGETSLNARIDDDADNTGYGTPLISGHATTTDPVTYDVKVSSDTRDTYYLVVEYNNNESTTTDEDGKITVNQNSQQGKPFSVTVNYGPKA